MANAGIRYHSKMRPAWSRRAQQSEGPILKKNMGPDACLADGPFHQKCFLKITDRSQMNLNVPLLYTYKTRMNNYRGLLGYLSLDLVPLLLVVGITSLQDVSNILLLFLLWLTLYEIGYLF